MENEKEASPLETLQEFDGLVQTPKPRVFSTAEVQRGLDVLMRLPDAVHRVHELITAAIGTPINPKSATLEQAVITLRWVFNTLTKAMVPEGSLPEGSLWTISDHYSEPPRQA